MMQFHDEDSPNMCVKYKVTSPTAYYCDTGFFSPLFTVTTKRLLGMRNDIFFSFLRDYLFCKKINGRIK